MHWTSGELAALLSAWLWPLFRIAAMLTAAPLFGASYVPTRVRLGLALVLTMVVAPLVPPQPAVDLVSAGGLLITLQQILIGVLMGFALRLIFMVFELAGQVIAQTMGLGFASMVDPQSGAQVPMLSQLYMVLGTLVFLSLNGHLLLIRVLVDSFATIPVTPQGIARDVLWRVVAQGGWVFSAAMLVALPAVAALLVVNMGFAIMTRAAPQLNIFAVGFPVTLLVGFFVIFLTLSGVLDQFGGLFNDGVGFVQALFVRGP